MEGNASDNQVYPVSRITGEGRAEKLMAWGPGFEQEGAGDGGRAGTIKGTNLKVVEGMHQFITYIL